MNRLFAVLLLSQSMVITAFGHTQGPAAAAGATPSARTLVSVYLRSKRGANAIAIREYVENHCLRHLLVEDGRTTFPLQQFLGIGNVSIMSLSPTDDAKFRELFSITCIVRRCPTVCRRPKRRGLCRWLQYSSVSSHPSKPKT
jgi:hypothetical protein